MDDSFTSERLHDVLGERPFRFFEQVTSTQDVAYEWAMTEPTLPGRQPGDRHAVVIAEQQIAGRGRQGRVWVSPPQSSIMASVILKPALPPEHLPRVTMLGALAVADVLRPLLGEALSLKWPNDVLIRGKKVCGILAESTWIGDQLAAVILGIGLNVRLASETQSLIAGATSLEAELGRPVNRLDLLRSLLDRVDNWAALAGEPLLLDTWRASLSTLGKRVRVYTAPHNVQSPYYTGTAEAVDDGGALLVRLDSGEQRRVIAADVGLDEE
ncbi:MAG: biotin--[acetyl-CoA-carboxylase] ligase [Chloroflexi bacterium]|nr:MAG: biotin--[acetyl-CoA-carboxylase] ligase [Chloroflexota bacterium]